MKLSNMQAVQDALAPFYEVAARTIGRGLTVKRMERFMKHLGHPERSYPVVHIAGTSGKTSTTYYTAALLHSAGKKVGVTVSPHVDSLTERVQIDGSPLSEAKFCAYMEEFLTIAETAPERPSWFELIVAFALWVFQKEKVDYAVLETGLGGLHDATNIVTAQSKLCVITDIGMDHVDILGSTLMAIAAQKAGIIHEGNTTLMYEQSEDVMKAVYFKVSQTEGAELYVQQQPRLTAAYGKPLPATMPLFQQHNWLLAYAAFRYLANRDEFVIPSVNKVCDTQSITVPARMQTVAVGDKMIVMDGAHNEPKMKAFKDSFQARYGKRKVPVLLALKQGKELGEIAPIIAELASEVIVTEFSAEQDWPAHSIPMEKVAISLRKAGLTEVSFTADSHDAFEMLLNTSGDIAIVTGSFYLISELRATERQLKFVLGIAESPNETLD